MGAVTDRAIRSFDVHVIAEDVSGVVVDRRPGAYARSSAILPFPVEVVQNVVFPATGVRFEGARLG